MASLTALAATALDLAFSSSLARLASLPSSAAVSSTLRVTASGVGRSSIETTQPCTRAAAMPCTSGMPGPNANADGAASSTYM